jgi:hypothetical protein
MKINKLNSSKKGFLLGEHTINIIIAVLCILLLVSLGNKAYGIAKEKNDLQKAEEHMDEVIRIIEGLKENGGGKSNYYLYSPKGWSLVYFKNNLVIESTPYISKKIEPNKECTSNCLCFCFLESSSYSSGTGGQGYSSLVFNCHKGVCFNRNEEFSGSVLSGIKSGETLAIEVIKDEESKENFNVNIGLKR